MLHLWDTLLCSKMPFALLLPRDTEPAVTSTLSSLPEGILLQPLGSQDVPVPSNTLTQTQNSAFTCGELCDAEDQPILPTLPGLELSFNLIEMHLTPQDDDKNVELSPEAYHY